MLKVFENSYQLYPVFKNIKHCFLRGNQCLSLSCELFQLSNVVIIYQERLFIYLFLFLSSPYDIFSIDFFLETIEEREEETRDTYLD